ncbi:hypothetical protein [Hymenobacter sp. YC55]|uniref:hypothetical protein n=1 Tax=Hymenobacter sp. YC55 TaxID=3034019 RepID=UPI0023F7CD55|nr:hypothetical protein [Hymenobacter sp. YC55]MDF7814973.1 hypothetical protein [Hymenobacter sp. YC55]
MNIYTYSSITLTKSSFHLLASVLLAEVLFRSAALSYLTLSCNFLQIMFATPFWFTTIGETNYFAFLFLPLVFLTILLLRMIRQKKNTRMTLSTSSWNAEEGGTWSGLPDQEIVTIAEYKAQKHRLLRS